MKPSMYLLWRSSFIKEFKGLYKVSTSLLNGVPLAGHIKLRTKGNITISFSLNNGCQFLNLFHTYKYRHLKDASVLTI